MSEYEPDSLKRYEQYKEAKLSHINGCANPFCTDKFTCDFITKSTCLNIYKEK